MKLPIQMAGLCASGAFIVTALPGFFQQVRPTSFATIGTEIISGANLLETLAFSLAGTVVAGLIGFQIGQIMATPQKTPPRKRKVPQNVTLDNGEEVVIPVAPELVDTLESYTAAPKEATSVSTPETPPSSAPEPVEP